MSPPKLPRVEVERWAEMLAHNARLDNPLPAGTDFTTEEMKEVQAQIHAWVPLPPFMTEPLSIAFAAKYLPLVATNLRSLSLDTQNTAFSTLVQILSLLPDPEKEHYFRRFLQSPQFDGIPNIIASSFVKGIAWLKPSGPGHISTLIYYMLLWCDTEMGDDKESAIDKDTRQAILTKLEALQKHESYARLDPRQRAQIERLSKMLETMKLGPAGGLSAKQYILAMREVSESQIPGQEECALCDESEQQLFLCSKCKTIKYCSKDCQRDDWRDKHKIRCYTTEY